MYYNRTLTDEFSELIEPKGNLRWLFDYVKNRDDLDFLIGKSDKKQWISVYRGLSRILTIKPTRNSKKIRVEAAKAYRRITPEIYGEKSLSYNFKDELESLRHLVEKEEKFDRYYKNQKEGFYQNILSRKYGILGSENDEFVIVDKEAVIGYKDISEKEEKYEGIQRKYKELQRAVSENNPKRYGSKIDEKSIGNELDFLALDKEGNILLIEYKHGTNTSGIYLSPLQIGMYYDLFTTYPKEDLDDAIRKMIEQKKRIGLINSKWKVPKIKGIVPVLIISDYNDKSSSKQKYDEVLGFIRQLKGETFLENIRAYNYTIDGGLKQW